MCRTNARPITASPGKLIYPKTDMKKFKKINLKIFQMKKLDYNKII